METLNDTSRRITLATRGIKLRHLLEKIEAELTKMQKNKSTKTELEEMLEIIPTGSLTGRMEEWPKPNCYVCINNTNAPGMLDIYPVEGGMVRAKAVDGDVAPFCS